MTKTEIKLLIEQRRHKALEILRQHGRPMTTREISAAVGATPRVLSGTCGSLVELYYEGKIGYTGGRRYRKWFAL